MERAIFVSVITPNNTEEQVTEYLDELEFLAETAGAEGVRRFVQKVDRPNSKTYVGSGKLEEIKAFIVENEIPLVIFDDELKAIAQEIVRSGEMDRIHIGLDFFDASINRIAAWTIGARNLEKALLYAMLEPTELLKKYELEMDYTSRLGLLETLKSYIGTLKGRYEAFYNEITKYTIVGLKDKEGKVNLFLYDLDSGKYTLYQELNFNSNKLFLLDVPKRMPEGLKKVDLEVNDKKIKAYKFDYSKIYYIIYGMNLNTGNKDFYMYDSEEHTIQRYDSTMLDKLTGEVRVIEFNSVVDCGTPINPNLARVQAEGGILQGIGMALTENVTYNKYGKLAENSLMQYKIPTRWDIGHINVEFEASYEGTGPFGAKSIGEVVINTPAPAIADAIYNATGKRFYELPITPEKIIMG